MEAGVEISGNNDDLRTGVNLELAKFFMEDSTRKITMLKEHFDECIQEDKNHLKELINQVVTELGKRILRVEELLDHNKFEIHDKVTSLELFVKTINSYQENLINTMSAQMNEINITLANSNRDLLVNDNNTDTDFMKHKNINGTSQLNDQQESDINQAQGQEHTFFSEDDINDNLSDTQSSISQITNISTNSIILQLDGNDTLSSTDSQGSSRPVEEDLRTIYNNVQRDQIPAVPGERKSLADR